jgi:hypothetical protein
MASELSGAGAQGIGYLSPLPVRPETTKEFVVRSPPVFNPVHDRTQRLFDNMTVYGDQGDVDDLKDMMNPDSRYWQHRLYLQHLYDHKEKFSKMQGVKIPKDEPMPRGIMGPPPVNADGSPRFAFIDPAGNNRWRTPVMEPQEYADYEADFQDAVNAVYEKNYVPRKLEEPKDYIYGK